MKIMKIMKIMEKSRIKASVVFDRRPYAEKKFDHKQSVVVIT